MYFEGCPRRFGCTVLLRGAHAEVLQKIKRVVQYAVFAAYHLSLETSFIVDEGATLLRMPPLKSQIDFSGRMANGDGDISLISTFDDFKKVEDQLEALCECNMSSRSYFRTTSDVSARYDGTTGYSTEVDNGSPCLHSNSGSISASCTDFTDCRYGSACDHASGGNLASDVALGTRYQSECKDWRNLSLHSSQLDSTEISVPKEERMTIHHWDSAIDNELRRRERGDDNEIIEYLSAVNSHQSILVSLSSHCLLKGVLCERSQLFRIKFYGNFDRPLGRYLRDELFNQTSYCRSCKESTDAHVRSYAHQQGSLPINVRRLLKVVLPAKHDGKIWMWYRCLKCAHVDGVPLANRRVLMSDAPWGLSFGKFLELNFSNHATANRVASCGHSLQRDCLRFYESLSLSHAHRYMHTN